MGAEQVLREAGRVAVAAALIVVTLLGGVPAARAQAKTQAAKTPREQAQASLDRATQAMGTLRCDEARAAADASALDWLRVGEPGAVKAELERSLAISLTCADGSGDRSAAQAAAGRLRNLEPSLGDKPPPGVPAAVWARYPDVDAATDLVPVPSQIEVWPKGARVWVDLGEAGVAPLEGALMPGDHWISAVAPGHLPGVMIFKVPANGQTAVAMITLVDMTKAPPAVSSQKAPPAPAPRAVPVQATTLTPPPPEADKKWKSWWKYAAAAGLVAAGVGAILILESGEDTQRIEVRWP